MVNADEDASKVNSLCISWNNEIHSIKSVRRPRQKQQQREEKAMLPVQPEMHISSERPRSDTLCGKEKLILEEFKYISLCFFLHMEIARNEVFRGQGLCFISNVVCTIRWPTAMTTPDDDDRHLPSSHRVLIHKSAPLLVLITQTPAHPLTLLAGGLSCIVLLTFYHSPYIN